ncbi:MAG: hypothetical protein ACK53A_07190 [Gemmatimonadota bacterium]|jgi:hypothetical protein
MSAAPLPSAPRSQPRALGTASSPSWWVALVEALPRLLLVGAAAGALVGAATLLRPRSYEAAVTVATVSGSRMPSGLGSLAGLSGLSLTAGLTATPDLVAGLVVSRRVLLAVADTTVAGAALGQRVAELSAPTPWQIEQAMRQRISAAPDRRTGLIVLRVADRDSALARLLSNRLVSVLSSTYVAIAKAQASAQRQGQETRVDSMAAALARAERAQLEFARRNRALGQGADAVIERQQLDRAVAIANQTYQQAVLERETALARELEQTPIVVVVDPLPTALHPMPRYTVLYALLAAVVAVTAWGTVVLLRAWLDPERGERSPEAERVAAVVGRSRLAGRLLLRARG